MGTGTGKNAVVHVAEVSASDRPHSKQSQNGQGAKNEQTKNVQSKRTVYSYGKETYKLQNKNKQGTKINK